MVKRFKRIQKFDEFSKCSDCSRRLPGMCQDTVKCEQCGTIRSDECSTRITAKIISMDGQDNKLSVKMGDQVLGQLVDNMLNQDEQTLAQKLLLLKMFVSLTTKTLSLFLKSSRHFLGSWILSFLYARSVQVGNRIFYVNKQLFLKRFINVITRIHTSKKIVILL